MQSHTGVAYAYAESYRITLEYFGWQGSPLSPRFHLGAVDGHHGEVKDHPGVVEKYPGVKEDNPGVIGDCSGVVEDQLEVI